MIRLMDFLVSLPYRFGADADDFADVHFLDGNFLELIVTFHQCCFRSQFEQ